MERKRGEERKNNKERSSDANVWKKERQKEKERERKSRVEGRQGINEPENKEGASEREWKERRGGAGEGEGNAGCAGRGTLGKRERGNERGT